MGTRRGWGGFLKSRSYAQGPTDAAKDQGKEFNPSREDAYNVRISAPYPCSTGIGAPSPYDMLLNTISPLLLPLRPMDVLSSLAVLGRHRTELVVAES
jgi:hypothetical protein